MVYNIHEKFTSYHSKEVIAILYNDPLYEYLKIIDPTTKNVIAKFEIEKPKEEILDLTNFIPTLVENSEEIREIRKIRNETLIEDKSNASS
ncbi:MAG: hypothetical protein RXQ93_02190 [Caldisphaera sp.]|jgi:hypothetical protein|uniref:hypothetical protein n=1 Tax=Caldisphaera sp. TaxID=2060322 RepID=UPI0039780132